MNDFKSTDYLKKRFKWKFNLRSSSASLMSKKRKNCKKKAAFNPLLVAPLVKSTEIGKVLVARRSKAPFGRTPVKCGAPNMGKKSWRETFGTIGVKVRSLSRSKFWKFDPWSHLKRTEPTFWSHAGQKRHLVARRSDVGRLIWVKNPVWERSGPLA